MFGDQTVLAYSMAGRAIVLKVARSVSFCLPQSVEVRALRTFKVDSTFPLVTLACSPKLKLVSRVRPKILGCFTVGMVILLMERSRVYICSRVQGVNKLSLIHISEPTRLL